MKYLLIFIAILIVMFLLISTAIILYYSFSRDYGGYAKDGTSIDHSIYLKKGELINMTDTHNDRLRKGYFIKNFYNKKTVVDSVIIGYRGTVIRAFVDDVSFDNVFILVDQKPYDSICECHYDCGKVKYKNWKDLPTYDLCEKAIKRCTIHHYWIINKIKDNLYGPFTKKEYLLRRKELGIPSELKLDFE